MLSRHQVYSLVSLCAALLWVNSIQSTAAQSLYNESPLLSEQVEAGTLPSIDERLPLVPLVVQPESQIGVYGGTWHMAMRPDDRNMLPRYIGYEGLLRWDPQWARIVPNVAQSYEVNEETSEYTFHLREGIRWSDGEPFTADDIVFWYTAILSNKDLTPNPPSWLVIEGQPVVVEKQDDYTVVFRFTSAYGLFPQRLATLPSMIITNYAKHYYEQFLPDYNPNIDDLIAKEGVSDWIELFHKKDPAFGPYNLNTEAPTLNPWMLTDDYFTTTDVLHGVRNPYYWKIDPDFNQLPYIDNIELAIVADSEQIVALAAEGKLDMQDRNLSGEFTNPDNMKSGDYGLFSLISSNSSNSVISLNFNTTNPVLREIFRNKDFRIGLSYAINRAAFSSAEPYQAAPLPSSPYYNEQLAKQYTEYDVAKANEFLDKAGYTERDAEGYRLGPDGKRISFMMSTRTEITQLTNDWKAVGIEVGFTVYPRPELEELYAKNEYDATVWGGDGGFDVMLEPRYYFPSSNWSLYAPLWARWRANPNDPLAEEPPAEAKQQMILYDQIQATADTSVQDELMSQILDIAVDQFYVIGINQPGTIYGIVSNNFHNVPSVMPSSTSYPNPAPTNPCQYYIDPQI